MVSDWYLRQVTGTWWTISYAARFNVEPSYRSKTLLAGIEHACFSAPLVRGGGGATDRPGSRENGI